MPLTLQFALDCGWQMHGANGSSAVWLWLLTAGCWLLTASLLRALELLPASDSSIPILFCCVDDCIDCLDKYVHLIGSGLGRILTWHMTNQTQLMNENEKWFHSLSENERETGTGIERRWNSETQEIQCHEFHELMTHEHYLIRRQPTLT